MLSMLATIQPGSVWKPWVDHITNHKHDYGLQKACLVEHNGIVSAASKGFHPTAKEIQAVNRIFLEKLNNNIISDRLSLSGRTYMIKSLSSTQIVAFSGSKYIIVSRSKTKHIIALCDSKSKYTEAADWLGKLCQKLIQKGF
ncbi:hypothetical protein LSH36_744g00006 [Paralvinella palmiformis]|uniref:Profilin n=1 Tax=Paralvinella palmiformis TaxID=53620 RepID=A0AAD9J111_9ANNE|nr:hypothetical protein LSH36_744g00006 [Paralvinella palmiformis]